LQPAIIVEADFSTEIPTSLLVLLEVKPFITAVFKEPTFLFGFPFDGAAILGFDSAVTNALACLSLPRPLLFDAFS
jgi:hypothetical protein